MAKNISIEHLNASSRQVAHTISAKFSKLPTCRNVKLFGIPRGGITAAFAIAANNGPEFCNMTVIDDPDEADVIIDDLVDSGATKEKYKNKYPNIPFYTLFGKPTEWISLPWERGDIDTSADDIVLRLLQYIGEEPDRGGLKETPKRFLKAWKHFTSGYNIDPSSVMKVFEDGAESYDEMVLVKSIPVYSQCEHHLVPFFGVAHIAYIPDGKIVGLSKLSRIVDVFARRLQVQERLTNQIAESLNENLAPLGVAVVLECRHLCMESRGISQQGMMTITSSMHGVFKKPETRSEFLDLIK